MRKTIDCYESQTYCTIFWENGEVYFYWLQCHGNDFGWIVITSVTS